MFSIIILGNLELKYLFTIAIYNHWSVSNKHFCGIFSLISVHEFKVTSLCVRVCPWY